MLIRYFRGNNYGQFGRMFRLSEWLLPCYVSSAKAFTVETGVAHAAKDGGFVSGDSYSTIELGLENMPLRLVMEWGMGKGLIMKVKRHFSFCKKYCNQELRKRWQLNQ